MEEQFIFFWSNESPFSNWHKATFTIDELTFSSTEQHMMYHKAMLFDNEDVAKAILETNNPGKQKALGRSVKNFDIEIWNDKCKAIVYGGNRAKFLQNPNLLKRLFKTEGKTLVEASPVDTIWGIGLAEDDPRAHTRHTWRGKNWLGEVLTKLRDDLITEGKKSRV